MTATQWLIQQLLSVGRLEIQKDDYLLKIIEQGKEIEKIQIIDACNQTKFEDIDGMGIHETITKGEQYFNKTYKNTNK
jgi:hypothetical protein